MEEDLTNREFMYKGVRTQQHELMPAAYHSYRNLPTKIDGFGFASVGNGDNMPVGGRLLYRTPVDR